MYYDLSICHTIMTNRCVIRNFSSPPMDQNHISTSHISLYRNHSMVGRDKHHITSAHAIVCNKVMTMVNVYLQSPQCVCRGEHLQLSRRVTGSPATVTNNPPCSEVHHQDVTIGQGPKFCHYRIPQADVELCICAEVDACPVLQVHIANRLQGDGPRSRSDPIVT